MASKVFAAAAQHSGAFGQPLPSLSGSLEMPDGFSLIHSPKKTCHTLLSTADSISTLHDFGSSILNSDFDAEICDMQLDSNLPSPSKQGW